MMGKIFLIFFFSSNNKHKTSFSPMIQESDRFENDNYGAEPPQSLSALSKFPTEQSRYFGGTIGRKELAAMTLLTVALYLINGEHARVVSIALTSVPAAIFSYRVLSCHETKLEGYNSILSYWTVYGLLALIDQFVETSHGYQLGKTVFLSTVLAYAARHNDAAIPEAWKNMKTSGDKIMLNTIHSSFDSTRPRDEESLEYLFDFSNENVNTAHSFSDCIVTDPAHHVTFSEHQQEVEIRMTNVSQQRHVMFALKTNADTHLIAAPTSGILLSGQSMTIRVGVADDTVSNTARISIDKLAIDHVELPRSDEFSVFSPDFFKAQAKRSRHAIRVYYE